MADTVRIYWTATTGLPGFEDKPQYTARVSGEGDCRSDMILFTSWDPDEFFRRYSDLTVTKEPAPEKED